MRVKSLGVFCLRTTGPINFTTHYVATPCRNRRATVATLVDCLSSNEIFLTAIYGPPSLFLQSRRRLHATKMNPHVPHIPTRV